MLPSPLTILAAVVGTFFVILTVVRGPVDADYWWHLTTGRLILESGRVPATDPFSFAYDGPWVAHEWLGEVLIASLVGSIGFDATAALFGLAAGGAILLPAYAVHRKGVRTAALLPFVAVATYGIASYATVRPQVLSWLLLGLLLLLLNGLRADSRVRPWLVIPLLLLWANLHGLHVIGLGVLAIYAVATLLGRTPMRPRPWTAVGMFVGAVAVSGLTPAGPAGLLYPLRYLRQDDWGTAFIAEWQSIDPADPRQWGVVALILAGVFLVRHLRLDWLTATGLAALVGALIAVRNGPIAMVAALPMLALAFERWLVERRPARPPAPAERRQRRWVEMVMAAVVSVAIAVILPGAASSTVDQTFPTGAFDRLEEVDQDARLLVDYDWAGFAIHRLHDDGGQVFIDGRSDMYPREVFEDYLAIREAAPNWESLLAQYAVEAILVPPSTAIVDVVADAGWCERFGSDRASLWTPCG